MIRFDPRSLLGSRPGKGSAGSVFTSLLAGVALIGTISYMAYQTLSGPVASMQRSAKRAMFDEQSVMVSKSMIASLASGAIATTDCDSDHYLEPYQWTAASGPINGGTLPTTLGLPLKDPWGTPYGYCAWDMGPLNDPATNAGCGAAARRLKGAPTPVGTAEKASMRTVFAVISAGPDRKFSASCYNYSTTTDNATNSTVDLVQVPVGKDDLVTRYTYDDAARAVPALWWADSATVATTGKTLQIGDSSLSAQTPGTSPDAGSGVITTQNYTADGLLKASGGLQLGTVATCNVGAAGTLRYDSTVSPAVVQYCNGTSWTTVGSGAGGGGAAGIDDLDDAVAKYTSTFTMGLGKNALANYGGNGSASYFYTTGTTSAIALRGTPTTALGGAAIAVPTGVVAGDLLLMIVNGDGGGSGTWPTGFQEIEAFSDGSFDQMTYGVAWKIATGGEGATLSYSFPGCCGTPVAVLMAYSGVDQTTPINAHASTNVTAAQPGPWTAATSTTTTAADTKLVYAAMMDNNDDATKGFTVPAGHTSRVNISDNWAPIFVSDADLPGPGGTQSPSGTITGAGMAIFSSVAVALKPNISYSTSSGTCSGTGSGTYNIAAGFNAASCTTSGGYNTVAGDNALVLNATGARNTALGYRALAANTSGNDNTAVGINALSNNTEGSGNAAIGYQALSANAGGAVSNATVLQMAPAVTAVGDVTSLAVPFSSTPTQGSTIIVTVAGWNNGGSFSLANTGVTDNQGGTSGSYALAAGSTVVGNSRAYIFYRYLPAALSGPFTVTVAPSGSSQMSVSAIEVAGLASASVVDVTAAAASGASDTSVTVTASGNTAQANELAVTVIADGGVSSGANNFQQASGWTSIFTQNNSVSQAGGAAAYKMLNLVETTSHTWNHIANTPGRPAVLATFKATTGGTTYYGGYNTAAGYQALMGNTSGFGNTAAGYQALKGLGAGLYNTAAGYQALSSYYGDGGTAAGYQALTAATGSGNTAAGYRALYATSTGLGNTAAGANALVANATGYKNTAGGYNALAANTTETANTAIGYGTLAVNTASGNTAVGSSALALNTTADSNVAIGNGAMKNLTSYAPNNVAIGVNALQGVANAAGTLYENVAIGHGAAASTTAATGFQNNAAVGYRALAAGRNAKHVAIGSDALLANTTGYYMTAIGRQAAAAAVTTSDAVAMGYQAFMAMTTANNFPASFGYQAGKSVTSATGTALLGAGAGAAETTTYGVAAIGYHAMLNATGGSSYVTAVGYNAYAGLTRVGSPEAVFGVGSRALEAGGTGSGQSGYYYQFAVVGAEALASGSRRIHALGYQAGKNNDTEDNFALGWKAYASNTTGSGGAVGAGALTASISGYNMASGYQALTSATSTTVAGSSGNSVSVVNTPAKYSLAAASAATTHTISYTTTGSGNTLIALVSAKRAASTTMTLSSVTDDQGHTGTYSNTWTLAGTATSGCANPQGATAIYYKSNVTSGTFNVRVTANQASKFTWTILEVSGLDNASPVDQTGTDTLGSNAGAITSTPGGALAQPNELVVSALMNCYTAGATTLTVNQSGSAPTNWTHDINETAGSTNVVASFVHYINTSVTSAPTPAHAWGFGNNTRAVTKMATFKGSTAGTFDVTSTADNNFAFGAQALYSTTTGRENSAAGYQAMYANTTGKYNTALGWKALYGNTTGDSNMAAGANALIANKTGAQNVAVGFGAGPMTSALSNTVALGNGATTTASNSVRIGNASVSTIAAQVALTATSDRRLKKDIADSDLALDFIMKLRPVSYRLINGNDRLDYGFIAQDVQAALGARATNIVAQNDDATGTWRLRSADLLAPVAAAVQQQQRALEKRQADIDALKADLLEIREEAEGRR